MVRFDERTIVRCINMFYERYFYYQSLNITLLQNMFTYLCRQTQSPVTCFSINNFNFNHIKQMNWLSSSLYSNSMGVSQWKWWISNRSSIMMTLKSNNSYEHMVSNSRHALYCFWWFDQQMFVWIEVENKTGTIIEHAIMICHLEHWLWSLWCFPLNRRRPNKTEFMV